VLRDSNAEAGIHHSRRAIEVSGPATSVVRGNAAVNTGICQGMAGDVEAVLERYEPAADNDPVANREERLAVALHCAANARRALDRFGEGVGLTPGVTVTRVPVSTRMLPEPVLTPARRKHRLRPSRNC
jgi:hypothetical protein